MPKDILYLSEQFMKDPLKILIKKEQLTLEGIKGEISAINGFDVKNSTLITKNDFVIRKTKSF